MTPADTSLQETVDAQEAEQRSAFAASFRPYEAPKPALPTCEAKFTLAQDELLRALTTVMKSVATRSSLPILRHIQMQAHPTQVRFSGTNLDTGIVLEVPSQVERTGTFTINARILLDCVKTFPKGGLVTIEVKDRQVVVAHGKRTFSLKDATDASDFPRIPDVQSERPCVVKTDVLRQAIKEVQFASGDIDGRPVHMAVCMHVMPDCMNLVAMDGHRMAIRTLALKSVLGCDQMVLVEASAWRLLCDVLPKEEDCVIAWDKERAAFTCGNLRLVARLIEGTYPVYAAALPKSHKTTFTLERSALVSLLNAFRPFTQDSSDILKIFYTSACVAFQAESDDLGAVSEVLSTEVKGEDGHVILNASYLADVLKFVPEESFCFSLSGYGKPCVMVPVGRNDYKVVVMPMGI